jgi:hypothetical protein
VREYDSRDDREEQSEEDGDSGVEKGECDEK